MGLGCLAGEKYTGTTTKWKIKQLLYSSNWPSELTSLPSPLYGRLQEDPEAEEAIARRPEQGSPSSALLKLSAEVPPRRFATPPAHPTTSSSASEAGRRRGGWRGGV